MSLTVVGTPDKKLQWTNEVYVAPDDVLLSTVSASGVSYVLVNDIMVFVCRGNEGINAGEIGLNSMQRECSQASSGSPVTAVSWSPPTTNKLVRLNLTADVIGKRMANIKEDDLTAFMSQRYANQAWSRGQIMCTDFQGSPLKLSVDSIDLVSTAEIADGEDAQSVRGTCGVLIEETDISIVCAKSSKRLTIEQTKSQKRSPLFNPSWKFTDMGIGGLDQEFGQIFRRSFASRLFPPELIQQLGIKHVKGMLLFGPPGTGKTLIARQIGKILAGREPKVVNGPEILNKFVGASEENIRKLFEDAEKDQAELGEASDLHIIIFDEIDAICKKRGASGSSTGVGDTVVNQMLSKIDGVNALNNILVIGMTNRKDMIDSALLRPGRLEVHVEIGLPDEKGRVQILDIHTKKMKDSGHLGDDVNIAVLAERTKNFSGAEIEGLVKSAASYALYGSIDVTQMQVGLKDDMEVTVTMADFEAALDEVLPAFGVAEEELKALTRGRLIPTGEKFSQIMTTGRALVNQVRSSDETPLLSVLLAGRSGGGKSAIAAKLALESNFPYVKLISPENFVGMSEGGRVAEIQKVFEDAYKSPYSLIILDNIERLLDYVPIGPRFSNSVLQAMMVLVKRNPPKEGRKLLIVGTTSHVDVLDEMQMRDVFNVVLTVPHLTEPAQIRKVFEETDGLDIDDAELEALSVQCPKPVGIKQLLLVIDMVRGAGKITAALFLSAMDNCGLGNGI